jgi:hypothetical protein
MLVIFNFNSADNQMFCGSVLGAVFPVKWRESNLVPAWNTCSVPLEGVVD